jgi:3-hydroxy-3-methylglutaryl CoA synthase
MPNMSEKTMTGILAFGAYVPRLRLQRLVVAGANAWFNSAVKAHSKGERAMTNWDEDVITMAVEAGRDCMSGLDRGVIDAVSLASTTAPNADRQNAGIVKEALDLSDGTASFDFAGGLRAGSSSLIQALKAAGSGQATLCVAAEKRKFRAGSEGELTSGDAAAALLVGSGEAVVARYLGSHSVSVDFVDHFRATGEEFDYGWEARWVRDEGYSKIIAGAVKDALASTGVGTAAINHLIVPITARGVAEGIAKRVGIAPEAVRDRLGANIGDAGTAHSLLMISHALQDAEPGDVIVAVGFGQGCDVVVLEVTDAITSLPARLGVNGWAALGKPENNYMKYLAFNGLVDLEKGMRAEADFKQPLTALYRNRKAVMALVGGRCTKTGTIQFPKSDISVNPNDHALGTQEDYPLAEKAARIMTYTADSLTYTPDPPAYYGMIEFEGGGRMMAEFVDADPEDMEVGRDLRMMFRIKNVDERRGFTKYFWKAVPVSDRARRL